MKKFENKNKFIDKHSKKVSKKRANEALETNTIVTENTAFSIKEAYKTLRTNIIFTTREKGCKKYVVTSSVPGEGKTTTAINLAISFAQTNKRVLLIDADLRKPRVHKYFSISRKEGLSNYLFNVYEEDGVDEGVIQSTKVENLDIICSGHIPPNPLELLSSENMKVLIGELESKYDFIIIDTPPINIVSDALVLSELVTGYVLVARSNYSEYTHLTNALSKFEIAGIKPLGVVLNDYDDKALMYRSNYKNKYRYKYDYAYGYVNEDSKKGR